MSLKLLLSGVSLACLLVVSAQAAEPLSSRVEVGIKGGTDRSLLTTEFWAPLAQKSDRVLYGDIRLMGDNDENREGNLGLGYRQIVDDAVLGVHGWIDRRRTQNNSTFHQLTFGVERLGHIVDARANVYVPLNQSRNITTPNIGQASPYLAGTGIFFDTNGLLQETPQYGLDGEIGYRIPVFQKHVDAIRVYGGGYHFFRDETHDVTGFRVRTEAQVNSAFSVGARFQHDDPRGSQGFLEATIKFPFGAKKLYQTDYLRARLDESPERDVDIVTAARQIDSGLRKPVLNETTGAQQRILHVDNTNSTTGNGSVENPFNTLKAAEAALQDNDILYINRGTGTTTGMDQGIIIDKANVQLIGSGSELSYQGFTLLKAGLAPVLTNTRAPVDSTDLYTGNGVLVTGANNYISGITVSGAAYVGIRGLANGTNIGNFTVHNVLSENNGSSGIVAQASNGGFINTVTYSNNTSRGNQNTLTAASSGFVVTATAGGEINNVIITDNISNLNMQHGLNINTGAGIIRNITMKDNTTQANSANGVSISTTTDGHIENIELENIYAYLNTTGIYVQANSGVITHQNLNNVQSENNTEYGIHLYVRTGGSLNANISQSTIINNGLSGIYINDDTVNPFSVSLGDGSAGSGNNRLFGNNTNGMTNNGDLRLDLDGGNMVARNNWWGQTSGPNAGQIVNESTCPSCGTADTGNHLTIDPNNL